MSAPVVVKQNELASGDRTAGPLLQVRDLKVHFPFRRGSWLRPERGFVRAVDGVSFDVEAGTTLGLVGESGCGKSTTARACLHLIPPTSGTIRFEGNELPMRGGDGAMRPFRRGMQMIFQDPFASLNPRMTVGRIISEPLKISNTFDGWLPNFYDDSKQDIHFETMRLMQLVGLNPKFLNRYPHEFSGGQRQRIGIARALAVGPKIIFCDEPVSALDVSIQAQVINLLKELQQKLGLAYVFIAHDLSVVRHISDVVGVMYLGRIVEIAPAAELYVNPRHPYTQALLSAAPVADPAVERVRKRIVLTGDVPSPDKVYPGCPFADRCPKVQPDCRDRPPPLEIIDPHDGAHRGDAQRGNSHYAACFYAR